ncbi:hypothetical protein GCM10018787_01250 [Streptomyces thermodiastaticus]|nr:hypothetical protein GCM10018787_01250 [Streptomyces thermodiastaticus]
MRRAGGFTAGVRCVRCGKAGELGRMALSDLRMKRVGITIQYVLNHFEGRSRARAAPAPRADRSPRNRSARTGRERRPDPAD